MKLAVAILVLVLLGLHASGQSAVQVCPNSGASGDDQGCLSLQQALGNVSSDSTLVLEQGVHYIGEFQLVQSLHNVSIVGVNSTDPESVTVTCANSVGLSFINMTDLTIGGITVDGCGLSGDNLVESIAILNQIIRNFYDIPRGVRIGMFFGHCEHLVIYQTTVTNTSGVGIVGINIIGQSQFSNLQFLYNSQTGNCSEEIVNRTLSEEELRRMVEDRYKTIGGGLFLLYEDYIPEFQVPYSQQQHAIGISDSLFLGNSECTFAYNFEINYMFSSGFQMFDHGIGGSGGLTLVLSQLHYGVNVSSTTVRFQENMASYGSGTHVTIYSGVTNTHVSFDNCNYLDNGVTAVTALHDTFVVGCGGMSIFNDVVLPFNVSAPDYIPERNVSVRIVDTDFRRNKAPLTGALSIYSLYTSAVSNLKDVVSFLIEGCTFEENESFLASAIGVTEQKFSGRNVGIQTVVKNSTFISNKISSGDENVALTISQSAGVIDLQNVNLTLESDCFFLCNDGTAIRGQQTIVSIDGSTTFERNTGIYGGALHLEEFSYLVLIRNSRLYFKGNVGRINGAAIFVNFLGAHNSPRLSGGYQDCFLLFDYDFAGYGNFTDINSTGVYIEFHGNLSPVGSIIFGSSLSTCYWSANLQLQNPDFTVFEILARDYPDVFNFTDQDTVGLQNVGTPARRLVVEDLQLKYIASPGEVFRLNVSAYDNFQQNIPNVVKSYISSDKPQVLKKSTTTSTVGNNSFAPLAGGTASIVPAKVLGDPHQNLTVIVYSTDNGGQVSAQVTVELVDCSVGFNYENKSCECDQKFEDERISCNIDSQMLILPESLWIGPVGSDHQLAVHGCIGFCKPHELSLKVYPDVHRIDFDSQCAEEFNRGGVLCGTCKENFSVSLGSRRCKECSNAGIALILLFIALGILLVFAISFLQITITAGYINGAILYANIVSLYAAALTPEQTYGRFVLAFFLSLNFGIETCFYNGLTGLQRVSWQLIFPLYLFILMLIIKCFAKMKWFNKSRTVGLSTIQAFATLYILCYVSVLESSVELLGSVTITSINGNTSYTGWIIDPSVEYFKNGHGFLAVVACLLIVFYVLPLPLMLLFPKVLYRTKYLRNFKPFYDAFYDPFEPSFRFWLGLRLMFRWIPFALAFAVSHPINTFVTAFLTVILLFIQLMVRPFKRTRRNLIDALFLLILIFQFSGAVFFTAVEVTNPDKRESIEQASSVYTTVLYSLASLLFFAVCLFHVYIRFPKLQQCCRRNKGKQRKASTFGSANSAEAEEVYNESYEDLDKQLDGSLAVDSSMPQPPVMYQASELREPLLDDLGSVEVVAVAANQSRVETRQGGNRRSVKSVTTN